MTNQLSKCKWFLAVLLIFVIIPFVVTTVNAQTTASVVAKMMGTVEERINLAQSQQINLLSPSEFRKAFEKLAEANIPNVEMRYLSMGMSDSYRIAIEGANMIRIGTKLFGERF